MDYGKLKKDELVQLCEERGLSFSSSWTKDRLEELLIEDDNKVANTQPTSTPKSSSNASETLIRVGTILNIVFAAFYIFILCISIIGIILIPGPICSIVSNVRYKNGKDNRIMAGVLGLLFSGIIGGILVLVSKRPGSR